MHLISGYNTSQRFMLLFYCLLVQCANPFHSNPAFPESDPWAVGGDLEVCKISVFHLGREVRFCAGFATLRPFNKMIEFLPHGEHTASLLQSPSG